LQPAVPAAERTIYIQPADNGIYQQASPEMILIINSMKEKLSGAGYTVVTTPGEAAYSLNLQLAAFDWASKLQPAQPDNNVLPTVGSAAGTAIGGAVSGSALHAATTTGGAVGGLVGAGAGLLLGAISDSGQTGPDFVGCLNCTIKGPHGLERATGVFTVLTPTRNLWTTAGTLKVKKYAADRLAVKLVAALPQLISQ